MKLLNQHFQIKPGHHIWWQLGLFLLAAYFLYPYSIRFSNYFKHYAPERYAFPSVFNERPSGLSGLAKIAKISNLETEAWTKPYRDLKNKTGTLVIVDPDRSLDKVEVIQILDWVKQGNRLIYLDSFSFYSPLLKSLDITVQPTTNKNPSNFKPDSKLPLLSHVTQLILASPDRIVGGSPLVADKYGAVISQINYGSGDVIIGVDPYMCCNRWLKDTGHFDNFQFLQNCFSTKLGVVYFDEVCHGFLDEKSLWFFLFKSRLAPLMAQGLILFIIIVLSANQRFGQAVLLNTKRKLSNLEFIYGMSDTYRRAKANKFVLEIIFQQCRHRLAHLLALPANSNNQELLSAIESRSLNQAKELSPAFIELNQALSRSTISDEELKIMVANCDKIKQTCETLYAGANK